MIEVQQVLTPVVFILLGPWFVPMPILTNRDATLSVALSLLLSVGTVVFLLKATAKVFRAGLLATGKRPTVPELWRWLKEA